MPFKKTGSDDPEEIECGSNLEDVKCYYYSSDFT